MPFVVINTKRAASVPYGGTELGLLYGFNFQPEKYKFTEALTKGPPIEAWQLREERHSTTKRRKKPMMVRANSTKRASVICAILRFVLPPNPSHSFESVCSACLDSACNGGHFTVCSWGAHGSRRRRKICNVWRSCVLSFRNLRILQRCLHSEHGDDEVEKSSRAGMFYCC